MAATKRSAKSNKKPARTKGKTPARTKLPRGTAKAKGTTKKKPAAKRAAKTPTKVKKVVRKKSQVKGKPKIASTRSHGGASKPPKRAPAKSTPRKQRAQLKKDSASQATGEGGEAQPGPSGRVIVENVNVPGYKTSVDAGKYGAMRDALAKALPNRAPGLTYAEMADAVRPHLPERAFPGGEKAGWWLKAVQLDMEAKGQMAREPSTPLRWHKA